MSEDSLEAQKRKKTAAKNINIGDAGWNNKKRVMNIQLLFLTNLETARAAMSSIK